MLKKVLVRNYEVGLKFYQNEFQGIARSGTHWFLDPLHRTRIRVVSKRAPWLDDEQLDVIVKSGALTDLAQVIDLKDSQRALVWIDGRFARILEPGLYAYWTEPRDVRVEIIDTNNVRLEHPELKAIARQSDSNRMLDIFNVDRDCIGVLFIDGKYIDELNPGLYAFWRNAAESRVVELDMREQQVDVSSQEIMTADKVTLRLNAIVTYRIRDARRAVSAAADVRQALYRGLQMAMRAVIGGLDLDAFLAGKDEVAAELNQGLRVQAELLGLHILAVGIKDVILPGDMKDLMNRVTEAKKAAEANLISRREETAAIRSQVNTAKLLNDNPTLMRLRELELLEKIATSGNMNIVLGEKGLAERVVNLL